MNIVKSTILLAVFFVGLKTNAQQGFGTNTPDKSAALDISSKNKGLLIPRIKITGLTTSAPITNPANGLVVYNTTTTQASNGTQAIPEGFYYWDEETPTTTAPAATTTSTATAKGTWRNLISLTNSGLTKNAKGELILGGDITEDIRFTIKNKNDNDKANITFKELPDLKTNGPANTEKAKKLLLNKSGALSTMDENTLSVNSTKLPANNASSNSYIGYINFMSHYDVLIVDNSLAKSAETKIGANQNTFTVTPAQEIYIQLPTNPVTNKMYVVKKKATKGVLKIVKTYTQITASTNNTTTNETDETDETYKNNNKPENLIASIADRKKGAVTLFYDGTNWLVIDKHEEGEATRFSNSGLSLNVIAAEIDTTKKIYEVPKAADVVLVYTNNVNNSDNVIIYLPHPVEVPVGKIYNIKKVNDNAYIGFKVGKPGNVNGSIEGNDSFNLWLYWRGDNISFVSDGRTWFVLNLNIYRNDKLYGQVSSELTPNSGVQIGNGNITNPGENKGDTPNSN